MCFIMVIGDVASTRACNQFGEKKISMTFLADFVEISMNFYISHLSKKHKVDNLPVKIIFWIFIFKKIIAFIFVARNNSIFFKISNYFIAIGMKVMNHQRKVSELSRTCFNKKVMI